MGKLHIIVLANSSKVYSLNGITASCKDENETHFVNENNFDHVTGLDADFITFIGECDQQNVEKFKTLIRE